MENLGIHILMEYHDCDAGILNNITILEKSMHLAIDRIGATAIRSMLHQFSPQGVTGFVLLAESHFAIHTWPEHGYAALDLFSCDTKIEYQILYDYFIEILKTKRHELKLVKRGIILEEKIRF